MAQLTPLAKRRLSLGIKPKDIAADLGVSHVGYLQWEKGVRIPRPEYIKPLAKALGVKPAELVEMIDATKLAATGASSAA